MSVAAAPVALEPQGERETAHARVYRELREALVTGRFVPGRPVTLRGVAVELGQQFATMVRERQAATLEQWLDRAVQSGIKVLRSLANGLRADLAAVRAGLSVEWSNGRTEGSVNRLKCVKRQMYGRGKLDLLRLRLIGT